MFCIKKEDIEEINKNSFNNSEFENSISPIADYIISAKDEDLPGLPILFYERQQLKEVYESLGQWSFVNVTMKKLEEKFDCNLYYFVTETKKKFLSGKYVSIIRFIGDKKFDFQAVGTCSVSKNQRKYYRILNKTLTIIEKTISNSEGSAYSLETDVMINL